MYKFLKSLLKNEVDEYAEINTDEVVYDENLLRNCKLNHCGKYNTSWMCPPSINQKELIREFSLYKKAFVISKITKLRDSFDVENLYKGRTKVEKILRNLRKIIENNYDYKLLGPGACGICSKCTYPDAECRFPELAIPGLEALGINVLELAKSCNIKYYNGLNTVTYFAAIFHN